MSGEEGEGTYVCTLDEATLKKAKDELNEDPKQRASQIETFRQWVKSQPHITSRTDDAFLLRFLRMAKFSQLRAQEVLDNYWTARTVPLKGAPEWFSNMDPADPENQALLDLGVNFPLPGRDDNGRKVVYISTGGYDPKETSLADVLKVGFMTTDVMLLEEPTQVHGFVILLDFSEFGANHVFNWSRDVIQKASKCWMDTYPTRNKAVNYYNTPTLFNALFEIFKYFMKEKMKKRLHFHKDNLESLHAQVPKRMLPAELGGTAGPKKELIQQWKQEVIKNRKELLWCMDKKYKVDESKRPGINNKGEGWGVTGSFRKLAVD